MYEIPQHRYTSIEKNLKRGHNYGKRCASWLRMRAESSVRFPSNMHTTMSVHLSAGWVHVPRDERVTHYLCSSGGVDRGHQALLYAERVVDDFSKRCEAVGGARRVAQHMNSGIVLVVVHAHHEHGCVGGRGADNNL